ncbi:Zinc carboxypeptidase A 1 [Pseudolycoriella hygida]|uniref:Zinc carboxypeptidase A 1 n=1 Tax=Pseudolycoriella hygida TaxID=35572 RepID=A0A9Q0RUB6_9DIPT|nr:Zinc carboxypeptidase A 1 [Pseudolycoriella hygida]
MTVTLKLFLCFQFVYSATGTITSGARYDNYRLYELHPSAERHIRLLKDVEENSDSFIFLQAATKVNASVAVVVAPHKFADFDSILSTEDITHRIVTHDVQSIIHEESLIQSRVSDKFEWKKYYKLETIYKWLDSVVKRYPNVTSSISAGESYQKRDIKGVKISYKNGNPGILIEGGIHAREWIAPAVATFLLNSLLTSDDPSIRNIAENFDWYIFPSVNPDGYVHSHTHNRLWRKTRKPYKNGSCFGADPNRNWGFHFGEAGVSKNPCSDIFSGPEAFSEIETESYSKYLTSLKDKIHTAISFHSYSQLLLVPYGHTSKKPENFDDLMEIGRKAIKALAKRYNTKYDVGNIYDTIYPASGASLEWIYGVLEIPLAFTYELRPSSHSSGGFELPTDQIIPTALETVDSIVALIGHAKTLGYYD